MSKHVEARASIGFAEFVVLVALMGSTQAFAIDAMLPAFPVIVRELGVANPNHGQWILTAYMVGLGLGQLLWGLFSDRFGRRRILLLGLGTYVVAACACGLVHGFEELLVLRFMHGAAAASMTVTRSMVRDLYSGRQMARVLSLIFVVFLLVPVLAPSIGQLILQVGNWRSIFLVCGGYASIAFVWAALRLPETLHPEYRLTLSYQRIVDGVRLVLFNRTSLFYALAMTVMFGSLMAYVGMVQQIFADVFHRASLMPLMFALCAAFMGVAAYMNSRLVERLGMRKISHTALLVFIGLQAVHLCAALFGVDPWWSFVAFQGAGMACFALSVSNFGAMAMEPVAVVAGLAASLQGFISTAGGALVGAAIGRDFTGTTVPLCAGALGCGCLSLVAVLCAENWQLFRQQHADEAASAADGPLH